MAKTSAETPKSPDQLAKVGKASGVQLTDVDLEKATGGETYLKVEMKDVVISSYNTSGGH